MKNSETIVNVPVGENTYSSEEGSVPRYCEDNTMTLYWKQEMNQKTKERIFSKKNVKHGKVMNQLLVRSKIKLMG